jgi:hypothetical protein
MPPFVRVRVAYAVTSCLEARQAEIFAGKRAAILPSAGFILSANLPSADLLQSCAVEGVMAWHGISFSKWLQ